MSNKSAVVLDASTVLKFMFYDELLHVQAAALMGKLIERGAKLYAPSIFAYECDSVIRRHVHLKVLSPDDAQETRSLIAALGIAVTYDANVLERAWEIANVYSRARTYDATYAAFAEARSLDLWTADKHFYNAVKDGLPYVKYVGEFVAGRGK